MFYYTGIEDENLHVVCGECGHEFTIPLYLLNKYDSGIISEEEIIFYQYSTLIFCDMCKWNPKIISKMAMATNIYDINSKDEVEYYFSHEKEICKDKDLVKRRAQAKKNRELDRIKYDELTNIPKCPTCGSERIDRISGTSKVDHIFQILHHL